MNWAREGFQPSCFLLSLTTGLGNGCRNGGWGSWEGGLKGQCPALLPITGTLASLTPRKLGDVVFPWHHLTLFISVEAAPPHRGLWPGWLSHKKAQRTLREETIKVHMAFIASKWKLMAVNSLLLLQLQKEDLGSYSWQLPTNTELNLLQLSERSIRVGI